MIIYDSRAFLFSSLSRFRFFLCVQFFIFSFILLCVSLRRLFVIVVALGGCIAIISFMRKIIGMQLEKSMAKWGACSPSVKTIKIEDFPNATLFLLYHQTEKQLVLALHCFATTPRN